MQVENYEQNMQFILALPAEINFASTDPICIGLSGTEQGQLKCGVDRTAKTLTFSDAVKFK